MSLSKYKKEIEVSQEMIDGNGHVNNVVYVEWMQEVAIEHASTWGVEEMMRESGAAWFARKHTIEYLHPVHLGETIEAFTWIVNVERVKSRRKYEFVRDGKVVAKGETEWVYVNVETGRPMRIPEMMEAFVLGEGD